MSLTIEQSPSKMFWRCLTSLLMVGCHHSGVNFLPHEFWADVDHNWQTKRPHHHHSHSIQNRGNGAYNQFQICKEQRTTHSCKHWKRLESGNLLDAHNWRLLRERFSKTKQMHSWLARHCSFQACLMAFWGPPLNHCFVLLLWQYMFWYSKNFFLQQHLKL